MPFPLFTLGATVGTCTSSGYYGLAVGGQPAPCAAAIAALYLPFLVDLRDDLSIAGEQRLARTHLGAQRQLALSQSVGAVFCVLCLGGVGLRPASTICALVH